MDNFRFQIDLK